MSLVFQYISSYDEVLAIREEWLSLEAESTCVAISSSYNWVKCWLESFSKKEDNQLGHKKSIYIVLIRSNSKLLGIIPLIKIHRMKMGFKFSSLEFLGQQWSGIQFDAILSNKISLDLSSILDYLYSSIKFDILYLRAYEKSSIFFEKPSCHFTFVPQVELSKYSDFDDYVKKNYSKRHKQNLRTGRNRAIKDGVCLSTTINEIDQFALDEIVRLSKSKLNDQKSWLYNDSSKKIFYTKLFNAYKSNVIFVNIDGVNVAYRANIIFNGLKLCLDASYDRSAPNYELGIKSVDANIFDSFERSLTLHSMGPGLDLYKKKFTKHGHELFYTLTPGNKFFSKVIYHIFKWLLNANQNNK